MYQFTDDCLVGIKEIDDEHRRLFQLINETMDALIKEGSSVAVVRNLLYQLKEYAKIHFAHEEAYMEQIGDKELERQKREHAQFAEKVNSYDLSGLTEENSGKAAEELLKYMARWLYRHILGSDIMIGKVPKTNLPESAFAFTDKYRTGIKFVDDEHKRLFEIIKETNDLIYEEFLHDKYDAIVHILTELKEYTVMHFQDEERYMESIHYEKLDLQRAAHTAFVSRLEKINMEDVDDNQQEYLVELTDFLLTWLSNHIIKMDKQIPIS